MAKVKRNPVKTSAIVGGLTYATGRIIGGSKDKANPERKGSLKRIGSLKRFASMGNLANLGGKVTGLFGRSKSAK